MMGHAEKLFLNGILTTVPSLRLMSSQGKVSNCFGVPSDLAGLMVKYLLWGIMSQNILEKTSHCTRVLGRFANYCPDRLEGKIKLAACWSRRPWTNTVRSSWCCAFLQKAFYLPTLLSRVFRRHSGMCQCSKVLVQKAALTFSSLHALQVLFFPCTLLQAEYLRSCMWAAFQS